MADILHREAQKIGSPITADRCTVIFEGTGIIADAVQFSVSYNQSVTRRRALGNQMAVIYGSMPMGQITIAQMITEESSKVLSDPLFTCKGGSVSFEGKSCDGGQIHLTAKGAMVSSYSISASADDLTVMGNITIDYLELHES